MPQGQLFIRNLPCPIRHPEVEQRLANYFGKFYGPILRIVVIGRQAVITFKATDPAERAAKDYHDHVVTFRSEPYWLEVSVTPFDQPS